MAAPKKKEEAVAKLKIDENSALKLNAIGIKEPFSDTLVSVYKEFKRRKDLLNAGQTSCEGIAIVSLMADMIDGDLNFYKEE